MRSSRRMIEEFLEGAVWADIKDVLDDWVDGIKVDVFKADDIDEVRRYQGRVEALEYFLVLPQSLINSLEYEEGSKDGSGHDEASG